MKQFKSVNAMMRKIQPSSLLLVVLVPCLQGCVTWRELVVFNHFNQPIVIGEFRHKEFIVPAKSVRKADFKIMGGGELRLRYRFVDGKHNYEIVLDQEERKIRQAAEVDFVEVPSLGARGSQPSLSESVQRPTGDFHTEQKQAEPDSGEQ